MKKLLQLTIIGLIGAALVAPAMAQNPGPRGGQQEQNRNRQGRLMGMQQEILKKLNLTKDQEVKIEALQKRTREEMAKLRQGMTPGQRPSEEQREQMREKTRAIMEKSREELMNILTKEQRDQFQKLMREAMEKNRQGQPPRPGGRDPR